ncbi:MAG: transposase [Candidatus Electronema sp. VV]
MTEQYIEIKCRDCGAEDLVKNGLSENGNQRYRCSKCKKSFKDGHGMLLKETAVL